MTDIAQRSTTGYALHRVGTVMRPEPGNPAEVEGVLNPAALQTADGGLRLLPRVVGPGNRSRIADVDVVIDHGVPVGVRRNGIALAPDEAWEHGSQHGGVEDPRIVRIDALDRWVMTYVAFGPLGPRAAVAISSDGRTWQRLGPMLFQYEAGLGTDLNLYPNKDVTLFPDVIPDPHGRASIGVLHRPMWDLSFARPGESAPIPVGVDDPRASIWISYIPIGDALRDLTALTRPAGHRQLALPEYAWETLKIGAGAPPIRVPEGWLLIHHGVSGELVGSAFDLQQHVQYSAGFILLDADRPHEILTRSPEPELAPDITDEIDGAVPNVVFPTATARIEETTFVFYGMADSAIGVARLEQTPTAH